MNRRVVAALCAGMMCSYWTVAIQAQVATAGDEAALKAQIKELKQKVAERDKAIEAQPAVADAKKAADAAAAARRDFEANNAEYAKLRTAKNEARDAQAKTLANILAKDTQYAESKKQLDDLEAKDNEPKEKLRTATPEARPALEAKIAEIKAQQEPIRQTMKERSKLLEEQPEVVAAKKAADDTKAAFAAFEKSNADYAKLRTAEKDARSAYEKARNDAEKADADRTALQQQIGELNKKIQAAKKGN